MAAKYFLKAGLVYSTTPGASTSSKQKPLTAGPFDLHLWLKRELSNLGVAQFDNCCAQDPLNTPIRYNQTASKIQYLAANGTWTNLTTF